MYCMTTKILLPRAIYLQCLIDNDQNIYFEILSLNGRQRVSIFFFFIFITYFFLYDIGSDMQR